VDGIKKGVKSRAVGILSGILTVVSSHGSSHGLLYNGNSSCCVTCDPLKGWRTLRNWVGHVTFPKSFLFEELTKPSYYDPPYYSILFNCHSTSDTPC
jgi:hypothetical protein